MNFRQGFTAQIFYRVIRPFSKVLNIRHCPAEFLPRDAMQGAVAILCCVFVVMPRDYDVAELSRSVYVPIK